MDKLGVVFTPIQSTGPGPASYIQIVNQSTGLCMDIAEGSMRDGTNVMQWTCTGAAWQKWSYDATTGLIRSQHDPRFCLDNGGRYEDGAHLLIWTCNGNANQRFTLSSAMGTIAMRSHPAQMADVAGSNTGDDIITNSNRTSSSSHWTFVP